MTVLQQPSANIEIKFFHGNSSYPYYVYAPSKRIDDFTHVRSYSYTETTQDIAGNFSISLSEDRNIYNTSNSMWNQIKPLDIVLIKEGDRAFSGIIHTKNFRSSINGGNPNRVLEISGLGIQSLFSIFDICFDAHAGINMLVETSNTELTTKLKEAKSTNEIVKEMWNTFCNISNNTATNKTYIEEVLETCGLNYDSVFLVEDSSVKYDIVANFFNSNNNTFYALLQNMFPKPVYECFGCFKSSLTDFRIAPKIIIRESPFSKESWNKLKKNPLSANRIIGYNVNICDSEVYTAFMAYIEGMSGSVNQYKTMGLKDIQEKDPNKKQETSKGFCILEDKVKKYGFKLLQANFKGFVGPETEENKEDNDSILQNACNKLKDWYSNIDEMMNGSIQVVTDMRKQSDILDFDLEPIFSPTAGEKIDFGGLEFYIDEIEHTWTFGEMPMSTLSLSRGGVYKKNGEFDSEATRNCDVTKRYSELNGFSKRGVNNG